MLYKICFVLKATERTKVETSEVISMNSSSVNCVTKKVTKKFKYLFKISAYFQR
jgi:hypothetical protein